MGCKPDMMCAAAAVWHDTAPGQVWAFPMRHRTFTIMSECWSVWTCFKECMHNKGCITDYYSVNSWYCTVLSIGGGWRCYFWSQLRFFQEEIGLNEVGFYSYAGNHVAVVAQYCWINIEETLGLLWSENPCFCIQGLNYLGLDNDDKTIKFSGQKSRSWSTIGQVLEPKLYLDQTGITGPVELWFHVSP